MITHNLPFENGKDKPLQTNINILIYGGLENNFLGTRERVQINHGKQNISVQPIKGLLYSLYDIASGSDITTCIKIIKPLVLYL